MNFEIISGKMLKWEHMFAIIKTGIAQGDISKLEHGTANPSVKTLKRLAAGMGMSLKIEFLPQGEKKIL